MSRSKLRGRASLSLENLPHHGYAQQTGMIKSNAKKAVSFRLTEDAIDTLEKIVSDLNHLMAAPIRVSQSTFIELLITEAAELEMQELLDLTLKRK